MLFSFNNVSAKGGVKFDGTWKLNKSESKVSDQFSFAPQKVVITQEDNNIHIVRYVSMQGQDMTIDDTFTLDGKECKNSGFQGSTKISTVKWSDDKKSLIIKSKIESGFGTMNLEETYSQVDKKLKVVSIVKSDNGNMEETWILEKE
jgi:hypothetical protein